MKFDSIAFIFHRALTHVFSKRKCLIVFFVLAMSGLLVVFFRGLAMNASHWVQLSLTFLPIFLCAGILLSLGIYLIRIYHDEVKNREVHFLKTLGKSWEMMIGSAYFTIPIILSYLVLWILLGIFSLLGDVPLFGDFFNVVLSFAPFLIHLGSLVLCLLSVALLFVLTPVMALKGLNREVVVESVLRRLEKNEFSNFILGIVALVPLILILTLLILSALLTKSIVFEDSQPFQIVLKWFFIMVPFTACLTPGIIFFFNFAAESHVLLLKLKNETNQQSFDQN